MRCLTCKKRKPKTAFYLYAKGRRHLYRKGARRPKCKACQHAARKVHRWAHPVETAKVAWRAKLKRVYGITPDQYDALLELQRGRCAICERPSPDGRRLHIDHDHKTKRVRGLLCHDCNRGLGIFKDSPSLLRMALVYLTDTWERIR